MNKITPLSVVDFRVLVYNILNYYNNIRGNYNQEICKAWLRAAWAININRGFTGLPYVDHTVVVVDDSNPYWRTAYLDERGFPKYKDGRKQKGEEWYEVCRAGVDYVTHTKSPIHYLKFDSFEADDIAAALVRCKPGRVILLNTVDSDWSGLVHDSEEYKRTDKITMIKKQYGTEPTVWWCNHSHWKPRFRDTRGVIEWTKRRCKVDIELPHELWLHKAEKGDSSDNLPPGSPIEVIDLLTPPEQHDILRVTEMREAVEEVAESVGYNSSREHLLKSEQWFDKMGFRIPSVDYKRFRVMPK